MLAIDGMEIDRRNDEIKAANRKAEEASKRRR
jgi:hypothetical protein